MSGRIVSKKYFKDDTGLVVEYETVSVPGSSGELVVLSDMTPEPSWIPSTVDAFEKQKVQFSKDVEAVAVAVSKGERPVRSIDEPDPYRGIPVPRGLTAVQLEAYRESLT